MSSKSGSDTEEFSQRRALNHPEIGQGDLSTAFIRVIYLQNAGVAQVVRELA
jgi:hypothetical protein